MKEFYVRTVRVWVKVSRSTKTKDFTFAIGYTGDVKAFSVRTWPSGSYPSTIKEAKEFAESMTSDYA